MFMVKQCLPALYQQYDSGDSKGSVHTFALALLFLCVQALVNVREAQALLVRACNFLGLLDEHGQEITRQDKTKYKEFISRFKDILEVSIYCKTVCLAKI